MTNSIIYTHILRKMLVVLKNAVFKQLSILCLKRVFVLIKAVIRNNGIICTVSALIASMAYSIIFLGASIRRVFPSVIFLSRDVAPVSAMCIVSSTSSICSTLFC